MKEESDFKKITIIGIGLIGGSLGLALKENRPNFRIIGVDKQADGGTHVRNLEEVGQIRLLKTMNKGKFNRRVYFTLV